MTESLRTSAEIINEAELSHLTEQLESAHRRVTQAETARNEAERRQTEIRRRVRQLREQAEQVEQEAGRDRLVPGTNPTAVRSRARKEVAEKLEKAERRESELEMRREQLKEAQQVRANVAEKLLTRDLDDVPSVDHVESRGWHGFRARFATKLKHMPDQDVAHLGGWQLVETLRQVSQREDPDSTRKALDALDEKRLVR